MSELARNERLNPRWTHANFYGLRQLRKCLSSVIVEFLDPVKKHTILDYGCGSTPYKALYEEVCEKYIGADIESNTNADVQIDPITGRIDMKDGTVDVVMSTQVLEHVEDPNSYLNEARRVCTNNGLLILSTHGFFPYHPNPQDYWRWTASGLKKTLGDNGWDVMQLNGIIGFLGVGLSFVQYSISPKLPKYFKILFEVVMQRIIFLTDRSFGRSKNSAHENCVIYVVVARKSKNT